MMEPSLIDDDWWPDLLGHIATEDPWAEAQVVVAEIRSFEDFWLPGTRILWSALIPTTDFEALEGRLIAFNYEVESTGRPAMGLNIAGSVEPRFWISAVDGGRRIECEPLILGWDNHNHNAMVLDPRFAMTYGLIPRNLADGSTHWDNPAEPEYDVAVIDPPAIYEDASYSPARAIVARDYLQDYLTLRGMELVQVFWESRRGAQDHAAEAVLGSKRQINTHLKTREIDVRRRHEGGYIAQVWGARHIAGPGSLPISVSPLETEGLQWPGIEGAVRSGAARPLQADKYVYVRDTVLGAYEGRNGFHVSSESGGVSYGHQWSVGPATRIGRDVIRIELRKLYEGMRPRVIQHWHAHAIAPTPALLSSDARHMHNVGIRSKELVSKLAEVGLNLCGIAALFNLGTIGSRAFVGLDRAKLDYEGWWNGSHVEPITRHIPLDMSRSDFLARCLDLDKLLIEPLAQKHLRALVRAFGTPPDDISKFRGLKLLDRVMCLSQVAADSGLIPWENGDEIVARYAAEGTEPSQPLIDLFAVSDLRQVAGHRKEDGDAVVQAALQRLGIDPTSTNSGWGLAMDHVYDRLSQNLGAINEALVAVLRIR